MGQICISINRLFVAREIAEEFTAKFVERARRLKIGDGMEPEVDLGPMFSESQRYKTKEHVDDALRKGAELLYGGREPEGESYQKGFFYMPTVLSEVEQSMKVMREETFGPVAPIMRFESLDQAIAMANDSEYGLAAYVFTNDLSTAIYASEHLEAGGIAVNVNNVVDLQAPFGGWKQSGFGRELGHLTRARNVAKPSSNAGSSAGSRMKNCCTTKLSSTKRATPTRKAYVPVPPERPEVSVSRKANF